MPGEVVSQYGVSWKSPAATFARHPATDWPENVASIPAERRLCTMRDAAWTQSAKDEGAMIWSVSFLPDLVWKKPSDPMT